MIATTAGALSGARLIRGDADTRIEGVAIDSREVRPGDLFVAIRGGHAFTEAAREAGAAAVLVHEQQAADEPGVVLAAADAIEALAAIGAANAAAADCTVVGVTGSSGKTSTKDALAAVLGGSLRVVASASSHNNEIGVPLTLCSIGPHTDVAICEMAMRGPGQIAALAALARPRIAVVTNVGTAHLGVLGSRSAIAGAKAELLAALPDGGVAVVPHGEPLLVDALQRPGLRVLEFGEGEGADVALVARVARPGGQQARFRVGDAEIEIALPVEGRHQALNVAAALAVAYALDVPLADAAAGATGIRLQRWRGEAIELPGGGVAFNEAYNANPGSLAAALEALGERVVAGRRIAVLGEMAELGEEGPQLHRASGAEAAAQGVTVLVAVGDAATAYLEGAGGDVEGHAVPDAEGALAVLVELVRPGDAVLVKGSRSAGLEGVAAGLADRLTNRDRP